MERVTLQLLRHQIVFQICFRSVDNRRFQREYGNSRNERQNFLLFRVIAVPQFRNGFSRYPQIESLAFFVPPSFGDIDPRPDAFSFIEEIARDRGVQVDSFLHGEFVLQRGVFFCRGRQYLFSINTGAALASGDFLCRPGERCSQGHENPIKDAPPASPKGASLSPTHASDPTPRSPSAPRPESPSPAQR